MQLLTATLDECSVGVGDRDARTAMDLVSELVSRGHATIVAEPGPAAPDLEADVDEPRLHLVGSGTLVWGRLLPNDGADDEEGRVRTFRGTFDDDVVRVVGITLAEASPGAPRRIGYDLAGSLEGFLATARPELAAQLDPKDLGVWLVAR
jgi:hypothetical protein